VTRSVASGLDMLAKSGFAELKGRSVGILCHHASLDRGFRHAAFLLEDAATAGTLELVCAFSPEHGMWGAKDSRIAGTNVDAKTGLTVHSLYGETYRPTKAMLEGVDTMLIDLQDVGARFYTYTWSMAHTLSSCEEHGIEAWILDRPNPIGGAQAEGPVLEPEFSSFVGLHPVAQRHGMTHGELAEWIRGRFLPKLSLRVVRMEGWQRSMHFEAAGLPWIPPSPNMPRVETAVVYPGTCLFEGTALSEGRGTTRPFETFGHPDLDGWKLAERLNAQKLPGVFFRPLYFQPTSSKHAGKGCGGCFIHVRERTKYEPVAVAIAILAAVREQNPSLLGWEDKSRQGRFDRLAGCSWLRESLSSGEPLHAIRERIESTSKAFMAERKQVLAY
jgi:uncharacterized protein YbbC (DUF1343 family)